MKTMMSNLPNELVEEIISRVPVKSTRIVRFTCKTWNSFFQDPSFTIKHIGYASASSSREKDLVMISKNSKVELIRINLYGIDKSNDDFALSINRKGTLISRQNSLKVLCISKVFHCNGLLLCVLRNIDNRVVVWNPYDGKRRWIKRRECKLERFALGYDKSCGSHKILKFFNNYLQIYDLISDSDSWRVLDATFDRDIEIDYGKVDVSLKGNTYWYARVKSTREGFLICFDFTRERFGQRLPLPFDDDNIECNVSLSTVREEKLAMLMLPRDTLEMEIWVTSKIEPDEVSWSKFLRVDMRPLVYVLKFKNFFIEEEKKIVVAFGEDDLGTLNTAYIIGEKGYFKSVDLRKSVDIKVRPFLCSYVPSFAQIE
ncbi:unnamed protein product [Microthlaspi erraticum]|uniref:F-box domain-containing protein n=1 Tax=Microthlaspi erraticum TaxID=1685480 RepID=A0A6D2HCT0_9BRAS|nr:unnamed protein product [Microthlaspi erraticum]